MGTNGKAPTPPCHSHIMASLLFSSPLPVCVSVVLRSLMCAALLPFLQTIFARGWVKTASFMTLLGYRILSPGRSVRHSAPPTGCVLIGPGEVGMLFRILLAAGSSLLVKWSYLPLQSSLVLRFVSSEN